MTSKPVTRARLASRDNFRLQVNADKRIVAFMYDFLADHGRGEAVREEVAAECNRAIENAFARAMRLSPAMADAYNGWLVTHVQGEDLYLETLRWLQGQGFDVEDLSHLR